MEAAEEIEILDLEKEGIPPIDIAQIQSDLFVFSTHDMVQDLEDDDDIVLIRILDNKKVKINIKNPDHKYLAYILRTVVLYSLKDLNYLPYNKKQF